MREVLIIGAGLAGAVTATVLGRRGISVLLLDEADPLPYCFKAEKLSADQIERFGRLGLGTLLEEVLSRSRDVEMTVAAEGAKRPSVAQCGMYYNDLVNAVRRQLPSSVDFRTCKVRGISLGPEQHAGVSFLKKGDRHRVSGSRVEEPQLDTEPVPVFQHAVILEDGQPMTARLIVVAAGHSCRLLAPLNIRRRMLSRMHSMAFGFTVEPRNGTRFAFEEFVYKADHTDSRIAFISAFRIGRSMRINMFAYWDAEGNRVRNFLADPITALERLVPDFNKFTGPLSLVGQVDRRPSHLQTVEGHLQAGLVLIGDTFQTNCPASGTGITKLLNDVELLGQRHIPEWLATPGMGVEKIRRFYEDPQKLNCDRETLQESITRRMTAVDPGIRWRWRRMARSWKRTARAWWGNSSEALLG